MKNANAPRFPWSIACIALLAMPSLLQADGKNCTIIMPPNPLTAAGLATPYRLKVTAPDTTPCDEAVKDHSAFVQAAILDRDTGKVYVYNPLVITDGSTPAVAPVTPKLPKSAVVALWFGFNGGNLTLQETSWFPPIHIPSDITPKLPGTERSLPDLTFPHLGSSDCHQGFQQFAYCNAQAFYEEAHSLMRSGLLRVPPLGISPKDHQLCPSVRSFAVVDQDQSDNLPTTYLITPGNKMASNTAANRAAFRAFTIRKNASDNRLTDNVLDAALGCAPWTAPDLADPGASVPALPLNELQAGMYQTAPMALIPLGDPFTLTLAKVNEYRRGVDQPVATLLNSTKRDYCAHLRAIAPAKLSSDQSLFVPVDSPVMDTATTLFTFMARRLSESYVNLGCEAELHQPNPVALEYKVTAATFH